MKKQEEEKKQGRRRRFPDQPGNETAPEAGESKDRFSARASGGRSILPTP